jgi:hypothetical protein
MMGVNRQVLIAVFGIAGIAIFKSVTSKGAPVSRILLGAYVLLLLLGLLDVFGGVFSTIAGGIAMLALVTMLLTEVNWGAIATLAGGGGKGTGTSTGTQQAGSGQPGSKNT